jgi:hypothetical protein
MARIHDVHVVPNTSIGGWNLTRAGRRLRHFATQEEAAFHGRRFARRWRVDLVTHRLDGRIRSKDSYGNEARPVDTEH